MTVGVPISGYLKQSTAVTIKLGPFVDETDGFTPETGLTTAASGVRLSKNGGNMAAKNEATALAHDELGLYDCLFNSTDTNTLGILTVSVWEMGTARPVNQNYMVMPANIWDSLYGTDLIQVDATQWLGQAIATPTNNGVPEVDLTHIGGDDQSLADLKDLVDTGYVPGTHKIASVASVDTVEGLSTDAQDDVYAAVKDFWESETYAEIGQTALTLPATPSFMVRALFKFLRNKSVHNRNTGVLEVYGDDATTVHHKRTVSDSGGATGSAALGEVQAGP